MMKLGTMVAAILLFAGPGVALAEVQFRKSDFAAALEEAKSQKLPVLIDFFAEWCGPCKMLDRNTWKDEQVGALSRQFVSLKVDAEKGEGVAFSGRFRVDAFPTIVFLDEAGKEVHREVGYHPPAQMLEILRSVLGKGGGMARRAAEDPNNAGLQLEAARTAAAAKSWADARNALDRAKALAPAQDAAFQAEVLLMDGRLEAHRGAWVEAAARFKDFLARNAKHREALNVRAELAHALLRAGRPDEAVAAYHVAVEENPTNLTALNGFAWFCASEKVGLSQALPVAEKAVLLSDRDPGILDTLAELRFARGELREALSVIDEAIRLAPDDSYYRDQKARFESAAKSPGSGSP